MYVRTVHFVYKLILQLSGLLARSIYGCRSLDAEVTVSYHRFHDAKSPSSPDDQALDKRMLGFINHKDYIL